MDLLKKSKKFIALNMKAETCTTREEAQKILKKMKKLKKKIATKSWMSKKEKTGSR